MESWLEHENGVQALKTWLTVQEEKLKKKPRIEDVASVQNALKDCQVGALCFYYSKSNVLLKGFILETDHCKQEWEQLVKEKEKDVEKAEERGNALIQDKKGDACSVVKETLKGLNQTWAHLDHMVSFFYIILSYVVISLILPHIYKFCQFFSYQISEIKVNLRSVLEQWILYRRASEEINGYLMEGRYSVSRLHLLNGSLEAVQQQVESLEVRMAEISLLFLSHLCLK